MNRTEWTIEIEQAISDMSIVKYFPNDADQRAAVGRLMSRFVSFGRVDQLRWLVETMLDRVGEWAGPVELRAVFCTRYQPADGIEADCKYSPGFTNDEMETRAKVPQVSPADDRALLERLGFDPDQKRLN